MFHLLQETGDYILQETGDKIIIDFLRQLAFTLKFHVRAFITGFHSRTFITKLHGRSLEGIARTKEQT